MKLFSEFDPYGRVQTEFDKWSVTYLTKNIRTQNELIKFNGECYFQKKIEITKITNCR